ncbi:MAG TPA: M28 family peptidase [bacterium]|nr:M28 family peptidase [bacterium]HQI48880.1 M28 family peptidase [bacterium]HQJ66135.1 M28 family peptidase [bacterium]
MKLLHIGAIVPFFILCCSPSAPDINGAGVAVEVADDVVTANLMPWIEKLAAVRMMDTHVNCEGFKEEELFPACDLNRDAAVKLVTEAFTSMGFKADTIALGEGPQTAYNITAEYPGTTRPDEVLLVASHLDAYYTGADDNSSAVAATLETARAVRKHSFARTIRFMAFDLEEFGCLGSTRYFEAGHGHDVVAAIVMDMIGYASYKSNSQKSIMGIKLPDKGDFLLVIGNEASATMTQRMVAMGNTFDLAKLVGIIAPGDGGYFLSMAFMRSDHGLLWYNGIPALFLTDTANFRNPNYHKTTDIPATLDPDFLASNTRALAAAVAIFAEVQK